MATSHIPNSFWVLLSPALLKSKEVPTDRQDSPLPPPR